MSVEFTTVISCICAGLIGLMAELPDAEIMSEIGKWPVTIALVVLVGWVTWISSRQMERSRESLDQMSKKIGDLAENLKERPCIRSPKND